MGIITAIPTSNEPEKLVVMLKYSDATPLPSGVIFTGVLIARVSSLAVCEMIGKALGSCEGARWQELNLYRTVKGEFVCQRIYRTQREGEDEVCEGEVCESYGQVIKFFGDGWLAKELYQEAAINASVTIEIM